MRTLKLYSVSACLAGLVVISACGTAEQDAENEDNSVTIAKDQPTAGFARLLAEDPLRHTYDFLRGDFGAVIQDDEVRNTGSHIDYSGYRVGEFTVGIQGGERGTLIDLGADDDVAVVLGIDQTVGGGQGFAHLGIKDGQFNVDAAEVVLAEPDVWSAGSDHAVVQLDHVYVLRIVGDGLDLVVKLVVVELDDSSSTSSFEWVRLR